MDQKRKLTLFFVSLILIGITADFTFAQALVKPGPKDTCPVCGMFVSLYPDWTTVVDSEDGSKYFFDGSKDMFKFIRNLKKWAPHMKDTQLISFKVTDYYTLQVLDAKKAFYVIGSDVLGPMGHELIPLRTKEEALEFLTDHKGFKIITFDDVTNTVLDNLDAGIFK